MITIIGTAHISKESVEEVRQKILELRPDIVAVELCPTRYRGLREEQRDMPLLDLIKEKNSLVLIANLLLSYLQRRMGEETGVKPGKEMLTAIETAQGLGIPFALIDRDVEVTLRRASARMGLVEKLRVVKEFLLGLSMSGEDVSREVEGLKGEGKVAEVLEGFRKVSPNIYEVLVKERDAYMTQRILGLQKDYGNILVVVGAGHKQGIEEHLARPEGLPEVQELSQVPRKRFGLGTLLKYGIPALFLLTFVLAFYRGISLGAPLQQWVLYHSVPTFLAVLLVGGSLLSALVGMVVAPVTAIHPLLAAGWFAGVAEMKVRRVTVGDVSTAFKAASLRELYGNKAFRVLLVTAFANIGSSLGTFYSFPKILLPLLKGAFGGLV